MPLPRQFINVKNLDSGRLSKVFAYMKQPQQLNPAQIKIGPLAEYQLGDQAALLLIVEYPSSENAEQSRADFLNHYLPDADKKGAALLENGKWAVINRKENLLAIVLEADNKEFAERLLTNFQ